METLGADHVTMHLPIAVARKPRASDWNLVAILLWSSPVPLPHTLFLSVVPYPKCFTSPAMQQTSLPSSGL